MSQIRLSGIRIAGVSTVVPARVVDNTELGAEFGQTEVRKVIAMAGVQSRHVADASMTSADLCFEAACRLLDAVKWTRDSIDAVILVTQTPDYFLPSSSCMVHKWLGLGTHCAAFDIGLGCSGYPYGLYLASAMLQAGGHRRILLLHGETPSRFVHESDHATRLLFGDAGSATALEADMDAGASWYSLHTDGQGYDGLIIPGGAFRDRTPADPRSLDLTMDGGAIFNFTVKRVPALIRDSLTFSGHTTDTVDLFAFHQSNRFIMKHIAKKCGLPEAKVPLILEHFGNSGGPSVALTVTQALAGGIDRPLTAMLLGYGVGLSWASATVTLLPDTKITHHRYEGSLPRCQEH